MRRRVSEEGISWKAEKGREGKGWRKRQLRHFAKGDEGEEKGRGRKSPRREEKEDLGDACDFFAASKHEQLGMPWLLQQKTISTLKQAER